MSCFILVAGRTGVGKTTFAEAFTGLSVGYEEGSEDDKFGVYAIADNLKFLTVNLFKVFKDENISIYDLDNNNTKEKYRNYLQQIGTECCRKCFGDNFWCEMLDKEIEETINSGRSVVISDIRYQNEIDYFKKKYSNHKFYVIKIERDGNICSKHSSDVVHVDADIIIKNDGDLDEFYEKIKVFSYIYEHFLKNFQTPAINHDVFNVTL